MLLSNARKLSPDRGYTLAEILAVLVLIGIGAALAAPNLISWSHRQKMRSGVEIVQGAMEDAQRQAIRLGRNCTVQLEGSRADNGVITYNRLTAEVKLDDPSKPNPGQCLVASANGPSLSLPEEIRIVTNIKPDDDGRPSLIFSFLGNVSHPNQALDLFPSDRSNPEENFKEYPMFVLYSTLESPSSPVASQQRRCVVIASMLGAIRTGIYEGSLTDLDANKCRIHLDGVSS